MTLNRFVRPFLVLLFLAVMQTASAQGSGYKIGFVNTARVLKEAPQARKVEERLYPLQVAAQELAVHVE